jgi:hypothetical protein
MIIKINDRLTLEEKVINRLRLHKAKERNMEMTSTCNECQKEYDVKEVVRVYGDTLWKYTYCSAQCYTKAEMADKDEKLMNKFKLSRTKMPKGKK